MIPYKRDFVTLNKAVINYLPRCSYHLLYMGGHTFCLAGRKSAPEDLAGKQMCPKKACREKFNHKHTLKTIIPSNHTISNAMPPLILCHFFY